ncbi:site-specific integrase [Massilia sp. YIM B02769]|uniref:site-specific integrase n=1 Tax=Massilia sp. YIM B02769 TaxID=3050129 RepID=UPI0025B6EF0B|nr:site-specific integrase [Massilia sp. YIM B02769]MDN4061244.1 site-specific integrase [Massilia sp. YIM B02769]
MAKVEFTATRVAEHSCPEGKSQAFMWDSVAPGLGLRATPRGDKGYVFQSKLNGQTIRINIGKPSTWTIKAAQVEARRLQTQIDMGKDPRQVVKDELAAAQDAREARQAALKAAEEAAQLEAEARALKDRRESVTLGAAWPVYISARRNAKRKGGKQGWSEWHVRDHENVARIGGEEKLRGKGLTEPGPLASLLDVRLADLSGKRISEWLASETAVRPTQAGLAFRLLSVFVNWCDSQPEYIGLVPAGACKAQQVRDELPSANAKDGDCLQREQLAPWFKAVRAMTNDVQSAYLQTLLLTGARRRELASLKWVDVDFQWLSMTIRDKVEGERTIPLTPYVKYLLAGLPRHPDNQWVFSSPASASGQLAEPTPGHKRALASAGLPDLTLHGLRRSFGSLAEWTETPAGVVAQIMGHKPSAIAEKHYRRRPLDLLRMWHEKVEAWMLEQGGVEFQKDVYQAAA